MASNSWFATGGGAGASDPASSLGEMSVHIPLDDDEGDIQRRQNSSGKSNAVMDAALGSLVGEGIGGQIAGNVLNMGKESAQRMYSSYARIDILRPYFAVELPELRSRLIRSFIPRKGAADPVPAELYGPLMLAFTLVTVLLFGMKAYGMRVQQGTLMGTSMAVTFGYWFGASMLFYVASFVFNTSISIVQSLSVTGYGLFGYCIALAMGTLSSDTRLFYLGWALFGGLASARMASVYAAHTADRKQGLIVGGVVWFVHWTYLLYIRLSYHSIYEAIANL
eukprot:Opistho-2@67364